MTRKSRALIAAASTLVLLGGGSLAAESLITSRIETRIKGELPKATGVSASISLIEMVQSLFSDSIKSANIKIAVEAKAAEEAAALKAAQEKMAADAKALAEAKAAADAAVVKAAQDAADASAKAAAALQAAKDAEIAAANAAQAIKPAVTLYSLSSTLKLSAYDSAYLTKYVKSLKNGASVTCIGYSYSKNTTLQKATALAKSQATAVCVLMKKTNKTLKTSVVVYPATKAPKAATGAKWVGVSYRIDGFKAP